MPGANKPSGELLRVPRIMMAPGPFAAGPAIAGVPSLAGYAAANLPSMTPAYQGFVLKPFAIRTVSTIPQPTSTKAGSAASDGRRPSVRRYWMMQPSRIHVEIRKLSRRSARSEPLNGPKPVFTGPRFAPIPNWVAGLDVVGGNIVVRAIFGRWGGGEGGNHIRQDRRGGGRREIGVLDMVDRWRRSFLYMYITYYIVLWPQVVAFLPLSCWEDPRGRSPRLARSRDPHRSGQRWNCT
jgi:hypothetical protein